MSWKFAGIIFKKDYFKSYPDLLRKFWVKPYPSAKGLAFSDAIRRQNQAIALGWINGHTMLLHPFISYDCSYEPGVEGRLDEILASLSLEADALNYIVDGEVTTIKNAAIENSFPAIFMMNEDEAHLFAVWETFNGVPFQEIVRNKAPLFHFFSYWTE